MITLDRKTGKVLHMDPVTPEQLDAAWDAIARAYVPKLIQQYLPELTQKEVHADADNPPA